MGWGSCIHQWSERVCSFLVPFSLEFDLLMIRACTKRTKNNNNEAGMAHVVCVRRSGKPGKKMRGKGRRMEK